MDIRLTGPETVTQVLDEYQNRFLPESDSQLLRAQFAVCGPATERVGTETTRPYEGPLSFGVS